MFLSLGLLRLPEPKLDDSICSSNVISVVDGGRDDEDDTENIGPMPPGTMTHFVARGQLPGYKQNEHIVINYTFEEGVQLVSYLKYLQATAFTPSVYDCCEIC